MAYFSSDPNKKDKKSSDPNNPFAFDIDEQGHSSVSRQKALDAKDRDQSMIDNGKHCQLDICGQLDVLPCVCSYCNMTLCRHHSHPEKHDCKEYIADLTTSPQCDKCDQFIRMNPGSIKTRSEYNQIISEHLGSGCTMHTFKRSDEEKAKLKALLRCSAPGCNNHSGSGKKLSTMICKDCNQQVCLSHRLGDYHDCSAMKVGMARHRENEAKRGEFANRMLDKLSSSITSTATKPSTTTNNNTTSNSTSNRLRQVQQEVRLRAIEKCKNPHLAHKQQQQQQQQGEKTTSTATKTATGPQTSSSSSSPTSPLHHNDGYTPQSKLITIPSRGCLVTHSQVNALNVKTALMQARTRTKNPANQTIKPPENKVYSVIYFPHTTIPSTQPVLSSSQGDGDDTVPLSTQVELLTYNQSGWDEVIGDLIYSEPVSTSVINTNNGSNDNDKAKNSKSASQSSFEKKQNENKNDGNNDANNNTSMNEDNTTNDNDTDNGIIVQHHYRTLKWYNDYGLTTAVAQPPAHSPSSSQSSSQLSSPSSSQSSSQSSSPLPSSLAKTFQPLTSPLFTASKQTTTPLYVCFDKNWTIKQCIDEIIKTITSTTGISYNYDNLLKVSSGKCLYTLSMLSFPLAIFTPSSLLGDILEQYNIDFDLETMMEQEGLLENIRIIKKEGKSDQGEDNNDNDDDTTTTNGDDKNNNSQNNINNTSPISSTNSTPTTTTPSMNNERKAATEQHKAKSATHRLNTALLPLHLAFGWYFDVPTE